VVRRLQSEYLALFAELLCTEPEVVAVLSSPPRYGPVVRVEILRLHHERRHEFDEGRLRAFGFRPNHQ